MKFLSLKSSSNFKVNPFFKVQRNFFTTPFFTASDFLYYHASERDSFERDTFGERVDQLFECMRKSFVYAYMSKLLVYECMRKSLVYECMSKRSEQVTSQIRCIVPKCSAKIREEHLALALIISSIHI